MPILYVECSICGVEFETTNEDLIISETCEACFYCDPSSFLFAWDDPEHYLSGEESPAHNRACTCEDAPCCGCDHV